MAKIRIQLKIRMSLLIFYFLATSMADAHGNSIGRSSMPTVTSFEVKCGRSGMSVHVSFDQPFRGVIYSKGHFYDSKCQYITDQGVGSQTFSFLIPSESCGTSGHLKDPTPTKDMYFENTIVIQNDPVVQEVWDEARSLRCVWKNTISKSVQAKSFKIEEPDQVTVDFDSRAINTLMQIQRGNSPFSFPATGYIYAEEDSSIVMHLQDSSGKLDANAVSCTASLTKGGRPIEIIDRNGCLMEPKMMSQFTKIRNPEGVKADIMMFANLKAMKVGSEFKMTCQLEICENKCLDPCALGPYSALRRRRRRRATKTEVIQVEGGAIVIAKDLKNEESQHRCIVSSILSTALIVLVFVSSLLCCISCYLAFKLRSSRCHKGGRYDKQ